jgi:hypothetical protein
MEAMPPQYIQSMQIPQQIPMGFNNFNRQQYQPDIPLNKDKDFMQWMFSFKEEVITPLKHLLNSEEEISPGLWERKPGIEPVMNQQGITRVCGIISSYVNPIYMMSNYDENAMNWTMRKVGRGVINLLCKKFEEYELEKVNIPIVYMEIVTKVHACLLSARGNGLRRFLMGTHHVEENKNTQIMPQQQKNGWGLFKSKNNNPGYNPQMEGY